MERGLLWLPLLALFIWLAWAGWNEYQKVEAYRRWAEGFEQAKYDVLSVLGVTAESCSWGRPTRQGPVELQRLPLPEIQQVGLYADERLVDSAELPRRFRRCGLRLETTAAPVEIPFTDLELAARWQSYLQGQVQRAKSLAP